MKRDALFLLLASIIFLAAVAPSAADSSRSRVDPRVLEDAAQGQVAQFLVVLKSQANTRVAAARAPDRASLGRSVYSALRQAADSSQSALRAQLDALGAHYRAYWIVNMLAVEGNQAVLDAMLARSDVAAIESNRSFHVALEQPSSLTPRTPTTIGWNLSQVRAPLLWTLGYTGTGQVYANADTGVQWDHPALMSHYRGWDGTTAKHDYNWWDAIKSAVVTTTVNPCGYNLQSPCDDYGHGTYTMGIGVGDDGAGNQIGMAPGAKWIACRNMDQGVGRPETYISCFQFFLAPTRLDGSAPNPDLRPDAVGNSYHCPPEEQCSPSNYGSMQTAIDNLRAAGVFMAVSAGNSSGNAPCSSITDPPAFFDSVFTVGATDSSDAIASFSQRGPITVDGSNRRKPDLVAPGVGVTSSLPPNTYTTQDGTSAAAPHIAGAVVLMWSAFPHLVRNIAATEYILEQSAVPLTTSQACGGDLPSQVPNNVYGYGRLDVKAAYDFALANPAPFIFYFPSISRSTP